MDLNTSNEKLFAFNNIFAYEYSGGEGSAQTLISVFRYRGAVEEFSNNLISDATASWYNDKTEEDPCQLNLDFTLVESSMTDVESLRFVDLENEDLRLQSNSAAIDAGMAIPAGFIPVDYQFKSPNGIEERPKNGTIDIGAFEVEN